jgi:hypothetical protein
MKFTNTAAALGALSMDRTVHADPAVLAPVGEICKVFYFGATEIRATQMILPLLDLIDSKNIANLLRVLHDIL